MSQIFSKLKYFPAYCSFCGERGQVFGAFVDKDTEVSVCPACADKLILGIGTAMEEMKRRQSEKANETGASEAPEKALDK